MARNKDCCVNPIIELTWLISAILKCPSFKAADVDCRVQLTTLTFLFDEVSICMGGCNEI